MMIKFDIKVMSILLLFCSTVLHGVIVDTITIWRKTDPEKKFTQYIYGFRDAHMQSAIAGKQVVSLVKANSWLKRHDKQRLMIINENFDNETLLRRAPVIYNYEHAKAPHEYFVCLALSALRLRLVAVDFRLIAAFTSNVFRDFIKLDPSKRLNHEFCQQIKFPQLMEVSDVYDRCNIFCMLAQLTVDHLRNEYLNMRTEIKQYHDGPQCQPIYDAIVEEVDSNAAIIFRHYSPQTGSQTVFDYIVHNTSSQERAAIDLEDGLQPRNLCGLLYETEWIQKFIDARVIHQICQNSQAERMVIALGDAHINQLALVLPQLGYEVVNEVEANEDSESSVDPKILFNVLTTDWY